ncbi:hypothetical protein M569_04804 [Genlisea aurea]|uniref:F-box domain-containing protein n=1 Tax=Genlisea aurea TaxID=192259 RepID=S8E2R3_9LAMI|nr:hypothetical protein M569_04804 [Genlisea aurea]
MAQERGEDRISGLPNDIIHQILSLLPIKSVAQTCVLSKRWRSLWLTFPDLDFTTVESLTWDAEDGGPIFASNTEEDVLGIERLLLKRKKENSVLRLFRLRGALSYASLQRLIECAVALDVQKLDIEVNTNDYFNFPTAVLLHKRLLSLRLRSENHVINLPSAEAIQQGFQSLTLLSLKRVDFHDELSSLNIFTDPFFPSLKTLALELCSGITNLKVQLSKLLNLKVVGLESLVEMELNTKNLEKLRVEPSLSSTGYTRVFISSPALKGIAWFYDNIVENWIIENITNLQNVYLFGTVSELKLKDFIAGISHCHWLYILGPSIMMIPKCKPFNRLTTLVMEIHYGPTNASAKALTFLLQSSPAIQDLTIVSRETWSSEESWNWDLASVESCLNHLKILLVVGFTGVADDMDFVRFVLKNAVALKDVRLVPNHIDVDENVKKEVRGFRLASPQCVIEFGSPVEL